MLSVNIIFLLFLALLSLVTIFGFLLANKFYKKVFFLSTSYLSAILFVTLLSIFNDLSLIYPLFTITIIFIANLILLTMLAKNQK